MLWKSVCGWKRPMADPHAWLSALPNLSPPARRITQLYRKPAPPVRKALPWLARMPAMKPVLIPALVALVTALPGAAHSPTGASPRGASSALPAPALPAAPDAPLSLAALAPDADPQVPALGLSAMQCAQAHGTGVDAQRLAVIDYSRSSLTPRLWVFDLGKH